MVWFGRSLKDCQVSTIVSQAETFSARPGYLFTKEYCVCDDFPWNFPVLGDDMAQSASFLPVVPP